jgi:hypothetical protein
MVCLITALNRKPLPQSFNFSVLCQHTLARRFTKDKRGDMCELFVPKLGRKAFSVMTLIISSQKPFENFMRAMIPDFYDNIKVSWICSQICL